MISVLLLILLLDCIKLFPSTGFVERGSMGEGISIVGKG